MVIENVFQQTFKGNEVATQKDIQGIHTFAGRGRSYCKSPVSRMAFCYSSLRRLIWPPRSEQARWGLEGKSEG